jgi:hypothetical protein
MALVYKKTAMDSWRWRDDGDGEQAKAEKAKPRGAEIMSPMRMAPIPFPPSRLGVAESDPARIGRLAACRSGAAMGR